MNFYSAFILILSVVYIIYIALQLHADYKKSRPLEGQSEEQFVFNPDNNPNFNAVKVTMNEDGISLVPEQQNLQPALAPTVKHPEKTISPRPQQTVSPISQTRQENNSQLSQPTIEPTYQTTTQTTQQTPHTAPHPSTIQFSNGSHTVKSEEPELKEKPIAKTRRELIQSHTKEYMNREFTPDELERIMNSGEMVLTEVTLDPEYVEIEDNNVDKTDTSTPQENSSNASEDSSFTNADLEPENPTYDGVYVPMDNLNLSEEDILNNSESNDRSNHYTSPEENGNAKEFDSNNYVNTAPLDGTNESEDNLAYTISSEENNTNSIEDSNSNTMKIPSFQENNTTTIAYIPSAIDSPSLLEENTSVTVTNKIEKDTLSQVEDSNPTEQTIPNIPQFPQDIIYTPDQECNTVSTTAEISDSEFEENEYWKSYGYDPDDDIPVMGDMDIMDSERDYMNSIRL